MIHSQAATNEKWLVRCSPCALRFSQSNQSALLHREVCSRFHRLLRFRHFAHLWVLLCLDVFHFQCSFHFPQAPTGSAKWPTSIIFSRLAGAQLADCITCLTSRMFTFWFPQTIAFFPVYFCLSLNTSNNTESLTWWIAHKALSRAQWFISHWRLVLLGVQQHP